MRGAAPGAALSGGSSERASQGLQGGHSTPQFPRQLHRPSSEPHSPLGQGRVGLRGPGWPGGCGRSGHAQSGAGFGIACALTFEWCPWPGGDRLGSFSGGSTPIRTWYFYSHVSLMPERGYSSRPHCFLPCPGSMDHLSGKILSACPCRVLELAPGGTGGPDGQSRGPGIDPEGWGLPPGDPPLSPSPRQGLPTEPFPLAVCHRPAPCCTGQVTRRE